MKKLLPILLLLSPVPVMAQTQHDYEQAMALFMKCYNSGDTNKICQLFRPDFRQEEGCGWIKRNLEEYGKMEFQEFVGIDSMSQSGNPVRIFKTTYSLAGVKAMSFSLRNNTMASNNSIELSYLFGTFSFINANPRIEQMVGRTK